MPMPQSRDKQPYHGPERRRSQTQRQGEDRRRPAPVSTDSHERPGDKNERSGPQQPRFDDIH